MLTHHSPTGSDRSKSTCSLIESLKAHYVLCFKGLMDVFMKVSLYKKISGAAIAATLISTNAVAQESTFSTWVDKTKRHASEIWNNGNDAIYLSGHAHHGRGTYTKEKLAEYNENAWGLGYGKTYRNENNNDESLYALVIKDSHSHPQYMVGYAHEWVWKLPKTPVEVSLGGTFMLMSRQDYFNSFPFPIPLPLASIGVEKAKLMFAYVPRLSKNKNNGDVLLIFARFEI